MNCFLLDRDKNFVSVQPARGSWKRRLAGAYLTLLVGNSLSSVSRLRGQAKRSAPVARTRPVAGCASGTSADRRGGAGSPETARQADTGNRSCRETEAAQQPGC